MADTAIERKHTELAHPATGELVDLTGPTDDLAARLFETRDLEGQLRGFKQRLSDEITRRMDGEASWTAHIGEWKVTGQSPDRTVYDGEKLLEALQDLVEDGDVTQRAANEAVEIVTTFKPRFSGINKLRKLGGKIRDRIDACGHPDDRPRRVSVTPRDAA